MSRDARALVIGALTVMAAVLVLRVIPGLVRSLRQQEETVLQEAGLLARARHRVGSLRRLEDSVAAFSEVGDALPAMLLSGGDAETASVDLMRRLRALLPSDHVVVVGFEPRRDLDTSGPLALTSVTLTAESDLRGVLAVLADIEEDAALAVEQLSVQGLDADSVTLRERLRAGIEVSGWYRPESAAFTPQLQAVTR